MARNPSGDEISKDSNVIWLSEATPQDLPVIGLKAFNLSLLQRLQLPVPPSFCITTHALRQCLENFGISPECQELGFQELVQKGRLLQHSLFKYPLPVEVASSIRNAYRQLTHHEDLPLVLRPSVPYAAPAFEHRLRPMLNIRGLIEFEKALKLCWAYIWQEELVAVRFGQEALHRRMDDLAILVQPFLSPEVSGSLNSYHPGSNNDQEMLIEAAWGLNESVSRGLIVPDQFIWQRFVKKISRQQIATKEKAFRLSENGAIEQAATDPTEKKKATLTEPELLQLTELAERARTGLKQPLELEWFKTDQAFYLLQVHLLPPAEQTVVQTSEWEKPEGLAPYFQFPFSPLGWNFLQPLLENGLQEIARLLDIRSLPTPAFRLINYMVHWHQSIPELFQQALHDYHRELSQYPQWKRLLLILQRLWQGQQRWQEEYRAYLAQIQPFWESDPAAGESEKLLQNLTELTEAVKHLVNACLLIRGLNLALESLMALLMQPYFQTEEQPPVYDILFQGFPGRKAVSQMKMDQLLLEIRNNPSLLALFRQQRIASLWEQLRHHEAGNELLQQIKTEFGSCGYARIGLDPLYPSWVDTPHTILQELQQALQHQKTFWDERVPHQRELLIKQILTAIGPWKLPDIALVRILLHLSQACRMAEEEEPFCLALFLPVLRRLAGGLSRFLPLDSQQDIFYLEIHEIRNLLETPMNAFRIKELKELIQARKYERKIDHRLGHTPHQKLDALELQGIPAGAGQYLGKARLILRSSDLKNLHQGEILITDYFEPAWEQALSRAGGLVMELGGALSHGARLARRHKIPVITSLKQASSVLQNGMILRMDGSTGHISAYQAAVLEKQEDFSHSFGRADQQGDG